MTHKAPTGESWIAGATGDVVVRPHSSGDDWHRSANAGAAGAAGGGGGSEGRELTVTRRSIHIVRGGEQDWIVRADGGRELGHYPSREAAEAVGHKLARRHQGELRVYDASGELADRLRPSGSWLGRMFGR